MFDGRYDYWHPPFGIERFSNTVAAGNSQATATPLIALLSIVTGSGGVTLLAAPMITQTVVNATGGVLDIYPRRNAAISSLAVNAPYQAQAGEVASFFVSPNAATQVYVADSSFASSGGSAPTLTTLALGALPTVLPGAPGVLWNNGGVLSIS